MSRSSRGLAEQTSEFRLILADHRGQDAATRHGSDAHRNFALQLDADDPGAFWNLLDQRASWFYEAVGAGTAMAPKPPGRSSAYLGAYKDKARKWLDGGTSYRLRVPPNPAIKLFDPEPESSNNCEPGTKMRQWRVRREA